MKRCLVCILFLAAPFVGFSAEITKETPIAFYSITDLAENKGSAIYAAALLRQMSDIIEKTANQRPDLFDNQPVSFLIEVLPSGFVRTLAREEGDPSYGITDSLNDAMSQRHWCFLPFWEKLDKENLCMERARLTVRPKCLIISAEKTVISGDSMSLEGDVRLSYGKYSIQADRIDYHPDQRTGSAGGSILLNIGNGLYTPMTELAFTFRNDGAFRNYFWEGYEAVKALR
jgi:hypothetical protein